MIYLLPYTYIVQDHWASWATYIYQSWPSSLAHGTSASFVCAARFANAATRL